MQPPTTQINGLGHLNGTTNHDATLKFDNIEDTISSFRAGNFIIVLDDVSRENEGDLIIAADSISTEQMAFMIRYTSGYVCAPLTPSLAKQLELPQMVADNEDPKLTAYTVSVDADDERVSTGISAHDRALTCRMLAAPKARASGFRRPGHVLPLRAREGGVLERRGHTEAAVEFCRLAGKREVGVIGEMVVDGKVVEGEAVLRGGGMMRRDGCLEFGRKWGLRVCTIADLVEYVRKEKTEVNGVHGSTNGSMGTVNGVDGHH